MAFASNCWKCNVILLWKLAMHDKNIVIWKTHSVLITKIKKKGKNVFANVISKFNVCLNLKFWRFIKLKIDDLWASTTFKP